MDNVFSNNNSIAVSPIIPQEGIVSNSASVEASGADFPIAKQEGNGGEPKEGAAATLFNKYRYDEFIGYNGKRLLDRILQQVLTHANWRTWHFADEFVAPGSDCYVGPYRLASEIRPGVRKVEMDFKSLRTLELMDIYPDYRLVKRSATGKFEKQAVMVKDFSKLYAFAHEYY